MDEVYVLHHEYEWYGRDEVKLIGVYRSRQDAEAAIARVRDQPGFRDWPEGFSVDAYRLGEDEWADGFATLMNILVPVKGQPGSYQLAQSIWRPGDLYEISDLEEPETAVFEVGDVVRCEECALDEVDEEVLVAIEIARIEKE